jgi:hypothetical protein
LLQPAVPTTRPESRSLRDHPVGKAIAFFAKPRPLKRFSKYLAAPKQGEPPLGLDKDPGHVITLQDGNLHISGEISGGLISHDSYENFKLAVEYHWGAQTFGRRANRIKISAIIVHGFGSEADVRGHLIQGYRCHLGSAGGSGDIHLAEAINSKISMTVEADELVTSRDGTTILHYTYKPGAVPTKLTSGFVSHLQGQAIDAATKGLVNRKNFEKPIGEPNALEIYCLRDRIEIVLNGVTVNAASKLSHTKGKIEFASEGAEITFANIRMWELKP